MNEKLKSFTSLSKEEKEEVKKRKAAETLNEVAALGLPRSTFIIKRLKSIPSLMQNLYLRACLKKASPKMAIKAFCQNCNGYEDVRTRTANCETFSCPLWAYRPYQN